MLSLGEQIQIIRKRKKLTQCELAKKVCVCHATVSHVENGHRELWHSEIILWAEALSVNPEILFATFPNNQSTNLE